MRAITRALGALAGLALFALIHPSPAAAEPFSLSADQEPANLTPYASYLLDPQGALTLDDARALFEAGEYEEFSTPIIAFGSEYGEAFRWVRAEVVNASDQGGTWRLDTSLATFALIEVFIVRDEGIERALYEGPGASFFDRPVPYRSVAVDVALGAGERAELYLRFRDRDTIFPLTIQSLDAFMRVHTIQDARRFLFYGALIALALTGTIFAFTLRPALALSYGPYWLAIALYNFHVDGFAYAYFWPWSWEWNHYAINVLWLAVVFFGAIYARAFFQMPIHHTRLNVLTLGLAAAAAFMLVVTFFSRTPLVLAAVYYVGAAGALLYCAIGVIAARAGRPEGGYFLAGAAAVAGAAVFSLIGHDLPGAITMEATNTVAQSAFLIEAAAFALAIRSQTRSMRRDRDAARRREIAALEDKLALAEDLREAKAAHAEASALAEGWRRTITDASHDMRQPIASLRLALARRATDEGDGAAALERHAEYLEMLVDRYLDETAGPERRYEGSPDGEVVPADVLLRNAANMHAEEAAAKGLELRVVPSRLQLLVDPLAAIRVLNNLVSNAVKHSPAGGVLVACRRRGGMARLEVWNSGPGMDEATLARMLEPGERGAESQGHGLGLAIVRELCEAGGWRFEAKSSPGRGARFAFFVPIAAEAASGDED